MDKTIKDREVSYRPHDNRGDKLTISSNYDGEHDRPSVYLRIGELDTDGFARWDSEDPEQVKTIIRHMAEMIGETVTFGGQA